MLPTTMPLPALDGTDARTTQEAMTAALFRHLTPGEVVRARLRRAAAVYLPGCDRWVLARRIEELDLVEAGLSASALEFLVGRWQEAARQTGAPRETGPQTVQASELAHLPEITNAYARLTLFWPRVVASPDAVVDESTVYLPDLPFSDRQRLMEFGRGDAEVERQAESFLPPAGGQAPGMEPVRDGDGNGPGAERAGGHPA